MDRSIGRGLAMSGLLIPGSEVMIVQLEHSPSATRAYDSLIGQRGVIVALLRFGMCALVELDAPTPECPQGVRRWSVNLDDLAYLGCRPPPPQKQEVRLIIGISGSGLHVIQHAVWTEEEKGLCGEPVRPLPFTGYSVPFSASLRRACRVCVDLAAHGPLPSPPS